MGDEIQPSKKRAAGRELSRDNPGLDEEDDVPGQEMGTFKKASEEVLASRKIVKVRRQQTSTAPSAPSSNPFAGIRLVPPPAPPAPPVNATIEAQAAEAKEEIIKEDEVVSKESEEKQGEARQLDHSENGDPANIAEKADEPKPTVEKEAGGSAVKTAENDPTDEKQEEDDKCENNHPTDEKQDEDDKSENKDKGENENLDASAPPLSSFQQLSNSQNAFTGLAGTGFSSSSFSFGSVQKNGSPSQSSLPTFSFGTSNNGGTSLFGTTGASIGIKSEGSAFPPMQEVPRETGEENEETVFSADSALFEFLDGGWKERGKGEVKVNVLKTDTQKARLVMRAKGNLRLILNASLFPDMKLAKMDKKGITFACVNTATEGKDSLTTFALKFKDVSIVEEFSSAVSQYKDKPATTLKTPENSP